MFAPGGPDGIGRVNDPVDVIATRAAYDVVASDYAELLRDELDAKPADRAMLGLFAEMVSGPVADVGCGPGRVTAHLARLGVDAFGIDLSPGMVDVARREHPSLGFEVGSMESLASPMHRNRFRRPSCSQKLWCHGPARWCDIRAHRR